MTPESSFFEEVGVVGFVTVVVVVQDGVCVPPSCNLFLRTRVGLETGGFDEVGVAKYGDEEGAGLS